MLVHSTTGFPEHLNLKSLVRSCPEDVHQGSLSAKQHSHHEKNTRSAAAQYRVSGRTGTATAEAQTQRTLFEIFRRAPTRAIVLLSFRLGRSWSCVSFPVDGNG